MQSAELFDVPGAHNYEVEDEVGHGSFSEVHRARDRETGGLVALKHMYLQEEGVLPGHVQRELRLLRAVHHPAVVSLLGVQQQGFSVALVLEHCLTDLRVLLTHLDAPLDAAAAKAAMQQLLEGLAACHAAGFVHRDLAPSNLLISATGAVKLADFGQARRLPATSSSLSSAATQASKGNADDGEEEEAEADEDLAPGGRLTPGAALCTRWYKAPELLFNSRSYGQGVDLWSAGCVFAEMLTGRPLLPGTSDIAQLAAMSDLLGSISEERWPGVRELPDWGKLIFKEQPPSDLAAAVPGTPPEAVQLLSGLLQYNPDHRLTAKQALQSPYFRAEPLPAPPRVMLGIVKGALARGSVRRAGADAASPPAVC